MRNLHFRRQRSQAGLSTTGSVGYRVQSGERFETQERAGIISRRNRQAIRKSRNDLRERIDQLLRRRNFAQRKPAAESPESRKVQEDRCASKYRQVKVRMQAVVERNRQIRSRKKRAGTRWDKKKSNAFAVSDRPRNRS